jgi:hypothetical protein
LVARKTAKWERSPSYFELSPRRRLGTDSIIVSPRERDILDVTQQGQNLFKDNTILDLSQSLGRNACRSDGLAPALGTGRSRMYAPAYATFLSAPQRLLLQGHDPTGLPKSVWQHLAVDDVHALAGNAMCVPVVGAVIAGALALLTPASTSQ